MAKFREDSRTKRDELTAKSRVDGAKLALLAPAPGLFRTHVQRGQVVVAGELVGELEVLGVLHPVRVPEGAGGVVTALVGAPKERGPRIARPAVSYGDVLVELDAESGGVVVAKPSLAPESRDATGGLVLRAPSSGRYYGRPGPGKEAFVKVGDVVTAGQTVALLEVMKTFHRVTYGGEGLPERAKVVAIVPAEESDLAGGDAILSLAPA